MAASPIIRAVRKARRRLFAQSLLNRLILCWSAALAIGLVWFLVQPLLVKSPSTELRWWIVGGLGAIASAAALFFATRQAPSRLAAALELDARFNLMERTTSALGLSPAQQPTPAGRAVIADAEEHARSLRVHERFPVRLRRQALWLPGLVGLIAVVAFVYNPVTDAGLFDDKTAEGAKDEANRTANAAKKGQFDAKPKPKLELKDRANRSKDVQELQEELARLEANAKAKNPADAAEKVTAITTAEEKAKALAKEKSDRLNRMENKLGQLGKLGKDDAFKDGKGKELNDALAGGDLDKAAAAADDIAKQLRDPNLDPMKREQLQRQLDKLSTELRRAATNQDKIDELDKRIADAKAKKLDATGLENELAAAKAEGAKSPNLEELADKLDAASQASKDGKLDEAANKLEGVAKQIEGVKGDVQDLKDLQAQQQRLNELKQEAAAQAGGMPQSGMQSGGMANGMSQNSDPGKSDNAKGGGQASGSRPIAPNAKTASTDERQRTPFDGKGQKTYSGAVAGGGFTKKSPAELGPAINQAVQEAPDAVSNQPLSRDDKEAVKEFYRDFPKK